MKVAWGIAVLLASIGTVFAAQPDRITGTITTYPSVPLAGSVYSRAQPEFDLGEVEPSLKLGYVTLMMQPSAKQQADLQQLLAQQQDPTSKNYHKWLTPESYADRYGMSTTDINKVKAWLQSEGFSIVQVARGREWIAVSGTAAQVEKTFQTQIHYFNVNEEQHFANATEISIPQALSGIVGAVRGLNDFSLQPMGVRKPGPTEFFSLITNPYYTLGSSHFLAPDDIATIYDLTPLYNTSIDGTGMKLVVVGQTDISTADINAFRSGFNLPAINLTQTLVAGSPDPGTTSDQIEADLDLEWSGAIARNANIIFVKAAMSDGGVFTSAFYAIDNILAPVISMSYGACESLNAPLSPLETELVKANSEGITFLASSGDTGAAACDGNVSSAAQGLAVNYPASSPEVTGVGGNEFSEGAGTYWNTSNGANGGSATSYIPETGWNDTTINGKLAATGGGASSCGQATSLGQCLGGFPKPSWQTGAGVPSDSVRDVPDVSISASADHDGYMICTSGSCSGGISHATIVGGTSASAPVFAGIVTLLNQFVGGGGLGNINSTLYQVAQTTTNGIFHDVTTGNNIVPCTQGSTSCPSSAPFQFGYKAGTGYDQVTGLGSVDANALVTKYSGTAGATTTTTITSSSLTANANTSVTFTATVTTAGSSSPTGTVNFSDGSTQIGSGTISSGKATFQTTSLSVGGHSISANYVGDSKNAPSTSAVLTETILSAGTSPTTTTVVPGVAVTYGTSVTFTANVTPTTATNTVTFEDAGSPLGFSTLVSGSTVSPVFILSAGTHSITGQYSGDTINKPSLSAAVSQLVNKANTTTTITAFSSPMSSGASVTFTATVLGTATVPTGSVTFMDGSTALPGTGGTVNSSGVATLTTSGIVSPGSHLITAVYGGDTNYSGSTSAVKSISVNAANFTLAAAPPSVGISSGQAASYTVTVTPTGSYTGQITFSCTFRPTSSATCSASPVTPNASAATTTLTISGATAAIVTARSVPHSRMPAPFYALWMTTGIAGVFFVGGQRKARLKSLQALFLLCAVSMIVLMFGCGGGSSTPSGQQQQQSQTYIVTIVATGAGSASGSSVAVTHTQNVSLIVN